MLQVTKNLSSISHIRTLSVVSGLPTVTNLVYCVAVNDSNDTMIIRPIPYNVLSSDLILRAYSV